MFGLRLHRGKGGLQTPAWSVPAGSADFRHRHVHVPPELCAAGADLQLCALSPPYSPPLRVFAGYGQFHGSRGFYHAHDQPADHGGPGAVHPLHQNGQGHARHGTEPQNGHAARH